MSHELQSIISRLHEAKEHRGRLKQIAAGSGISYRTIYSIMNVEPPIASASTVDKLAAYFKKADKKLAKGPRNGS